MYNRMFLFVWGNELSIWSPHFLVSRAVESMLGLITSLASLDHAAGFARPLQLGCYGDATVYITNFDFTRETLF